MSSEFDAATKIGIHKREPLSLQEHSEIRVRVKATSARTRVQEVLNLMRGFNPELVDLGFQGGLGRVITVIAKVESGTAQLLFSLPESEYQLSYIVHVTHECQHMKAFETFFRISAAKKKAPNFTAAETREILDELDATFGTRK